MNADDQLYHDAVDLVIRTQKASPSILQRRLRIGRQQAEDLLDEMAMLNIVSASNGIGQRKVLVQDETA